MISLGGKFQHPELNISLKTEIELKQCEYRDYLLMDRVAVLLFL